MGFVASWTGEGKIGNLNGEIPSQIGQLTNLELLDNYYIFVIPKKICRYALSYRLKQRDSDVI